MKNIKKGERHLLSDICSGNSMPEFTIEVNTASAGFPSQALDISVFCLNQNKKMDSEFDIVFMNNDKSSGNEVNLVPNTDSIFNISIPNVVRAQNRIHSIVVCAAIDSNLFNGNFQNAFLNPNNGIQITLKYQNQAVATAYITRQDVATEKALTLFEVYLKQGVWRLTNVTQGFNGGLRELVLHYGGEVEPIQPTQQIHGRNPNQNFGGNQNQNFGGNQNQNFGGNQNQNFGSNQNQNFGSNQNQNFGGNQNQNFGGQQNNFQQPSSKANLVSLKKEKIFNDFSKKAPQLVSLAKRSVEILERKNILGIRAKVALVLDASGSMNTQYSRGDVQKVVDRLMPIASAFDDDGEFECWAFAEQTYQIDNVNLGNLQNYITSTRGGWRNWRVGSRVNNEVDALNAVMQFYTHNNPEKLPVFVLFISDGGVHSDRQIEQAIRNSTNHPIFWQFVGLGGRGYGILEKLDTMTGRNIDNCNFFALDNINQLNDSEIYEYLLNEFPVWLTQAEQINLIPRQL